MELPERIKAEEPVKFDGHAEEIDFSLEAVELKEHLVPVIMSVGNKVLYGLMDRDNLEMQKTRERETVRVSNYSTQIINVEATCRGVLSVAMLA